MSAQTATNPDSEKDFKPFSNLVTEIHSYRDQWKNDLSVAIGVPFKGTVKVLLKNRMVPVDQLPSGVNNVSSSEDYAKEFHFCVSGHVNQQISEGKAGGISFGKFDILKSKIQKIIFMYPDGSEVVAW